MLISTLNDLLQERKGKRGNPTLLLLKFNKRIADELFQASQKHRTAEYLGYQVENNEKKLPKQSS